MAFEIPTLSDLVERARRAFRAHLPGADAWLWPNNVGPTAKVFGGLVKELFDRVAIVERRQFTTTADLDGLLKQGEDLSMPRLPAAPADGSVTVTAAAEGVVVSAGAVFRRGDGIEYLSLATASRNMAGEVTVLVVAAADGLAGNAISGTPLTIVSGVVGAGAAAAVGSDGINAGEDVEGVEAYRERILFRKRYTPQGGSAPDYWRWGREVAGVTRVFVEPLAYGRCSTKVLILMDNRYESGIGPQAEADRVAAYLATKQPSGAVVGVVFPIARIIDVTVSGLIPDNDDTREAVIAELRDTFYRKQRPAGNAVPHGGMDFLAIPETFSRSWLWQAVANAAGEERHEILVPSADVVLATGEMAVLGAVTFEA